MELMTMVVGLARIRVLTISAAVLHGALHAGCERQTTADGQEHQRLQQQQNLGLEGVHLGRNDWDCGCFHTEECRQCRSGSSSRCMRQPKPVATGAMNGVTVVIWRLVPESECFFASGEPLRGEPPPHGSVLAEPGSAKSPMQQWGSF